MVQAKNMYKIDKAFYGKNACMWTETKFRLINSKFYFYIFSHSPVFFCRKNSKFRLTKATTLYLTPFTSGT